MALEETYDYGVSNEQAAVLKTEVSIRLGQQECFSPRGRECQWVWSVGVAGEVAVGGRIYVQETGW